MKKYKVLIGPKLTNDTKAAINNVLEDIADIYYLESVPKNERLFLIKKTHALILTRPKKELTKEEIECLEGKFIQSFISGVDSFPLEEFPKDLTIAHNGGAFASPISEYIVGVVINSLREISDKYLKLKNGNWDQFSETRSLDGLVCGIVGYGGIGKKTAYLLKKFGMRIMAINRSGYTDDQIDFIGNLSNIDELLKKSDVIVLSISLNNLTKNLIDEKKIKLLKRDSIIINVSRGDVIQQKALYDWLKSNAKAKACIDAWWREPVTHGDFRLEYPFFDLPNFFGSPHNSAITQGAFKEAGYSAAKNVRSYLKKEKVKRIITSVDH